MRPALRSLATLVVVLVIYYACPTGELTSSAVVGVLVLLIGIGVLARLIADQVRQQFRDGDENSVRVQSLLVLVYMTVLLFSLGYVMLAESTDGQFAGLETKTDSLYFTVTTLATVGFGDVHPVGQLARALVTAQIAFNLVFIGALVSLLRARATELRGRRPPSGS